MTISSNLENIDWAALADLYVIYGDTPLSRRDPGKLKRAFEKSYRVCIARHGKILVGAGRVISDGEYYAKVHDVVVTTEFQGQGIGTRILKELIRDLDEQFVLLTTDIGKEGFYRRMGFRRHKAAMALYPESARTDAELLLE